MDRVPLSQLPLTADEAQVLAQNLREGFGWDDDRDITCEKCPENRVCEYAFDPYNTDGDCLALK